MWKQLGRVLEAAIFAFIAFVSAVIAVSAVHVLMREGAPAEPGDTSEVESSTQSSVDSSSPAAEPKAS